MGTTIKKLDVKITADSSGLKSGIKQSEQSVNSFSKSLKGMAGSLGLAFGGVAILRGIKSTTDAFLEHNKVTTQLGAVLRSTGEAAGYQKGELIKMADAMQNLTTFSNTAIIETQNLLLTFTKIGKETFPNALETVLDMSQALGQDLKSSAIQLGKALNDPILGVTALQRVGVMFTAEQKKLIKSLAETGRVAEAQKIILAELNVEFGGSAREAITSYAGKIEQLKNRFADLKRGIGETIIDVVFFSDTMKETGTRMSDNFAMQDKAFRSLFAQYRDAGADVETLRNAMREMGKTVGEGNENFYAQLIAVRRNIKQFPELAKANDAVTKARQAELKPLTEANRKREEAAEKLKKETEAAEAAEKVNKDLNKTIKEQVVLWSDLVGEMPQVEWGFSRVEKEAYDFDKTLEEINKEFEDLIPFADRLGESFDDLSPFTFKLSKDIDNLDDSFAGIKFSIDDLFDAMQQLGDYIGGEFGSVLSDLGGIAAKIASGDWVGATIAGIGALPNIAEWLWGGMMHELSEEQKALNAAIEAEMQAVRDSLSPEELERYLELMFQQNSLFGINIMSMEDFIELQVLMGREFVSVTSEGAVFTDMLNGLTDGLDSAGNSAEELTGDMTDVENAFDSAGNSLQEFEDMLSGISGVSVDVGVNTPSGKIKPSIGEGFASGANFTVPSGFDNDSFPMRVSSGEHVTVTPQGQGGVGSMNFDITINAGQGANGRDLADQFIQQLRLNKSSIQKEIRAII